MQTAIMKFDLSWVVDPTPEELREEGAKFTQTKGCGPYPGYRKNSPETNRKISESLMGNVPWNKGLKGVQTPSEQSKQKMSDSAKKSFENGRVQWNKGTSKFNSEEERLEARRQARRKYEQANREEINRKKREKYAERKSK